jgi:AcrR family transcriptional regulator
MQGKIKKKTETRTRLLQAGGEIFAQYGFRGATVRRIARKAQANVAAVNYYFASKEGLYLAVLEHTFATAKGKYPPDQGLAENAGAEERLRAFIGSLLMRILDTGRPAWHGRLMIREIADPSPVLDRMVDEAIRPMYDRLAGIVGELLAPGADEEAVRLGTMSVMGQCLFYHHAGPVISRLHREKLDAAGIRAVADHITAFSLLALQGRGGGAGGNRR